MTSDQAVREGLAAAMSAEPGTESAKAGLADALSKLPFYASHPSPAVRIGEARADICPSNLAHRIIRYANERGLDEAISALDDLLSIGIITTTTYVYVENVETEIEIDIGGGVRALPVDASPPYFVEAAIRARSPRSMRKGIVLTAQEVDSPFVKLPKSADPMIVPPLQVPSRESIDNALRMITVSGPCAPAARLRTTVVHSDALRLFQVTGGIYDYPSTVGLASRSHTLDDSPNHLLALYSKLSGKTRKMMNGAINRLNLACARDDPSDAVVDTAISLEAMLGDAADKTELTYRLKLRAALLTEPGLAEREIIRKLVGDLYSVRSKVVHTGLSSNSDSQLADKGTALASRVIRKILELGGMPEWSVCELSGGSQLGNIS